MKHGTVLVADNHSPILEGVRSLLEERFESVVMVADVSSLLQTAEKLRPDFVVVDVSLPVIGTKNVVTVLRERYPDVPLIALSIHDESVAVERVLASGASAFVLKRCATTDLLPALDEVSAGRVYVSPAATGLLKGPHTENHGRTNHRTSKEE
jgi:DNA-binding NarL/FixJ family response regulator